MAIVYGNPGPVTLEFDPSKYLDDDEAIADYIRLAIEDCDPGLLAAALGDVARARGMTQVAQAAGLTRLTTGISC